MIEPLRIAIADGEAENCRYYGRILPQMGHTVAGTAASEAELQAVCREGKVDLFIVDEMLPGLHGLAGVSDLARQLGVPTLIVSSSDALDREQQSGFDQGFDYLIKPFKKAELESAIESAISHKIGLNVIRRR
jgi:DNA-binding response OmpR family regulator